MILLRENIRVLSHELLGFVDRNFDFTAKIVSQKICENKLKLCGSNKTY